LTNNNLSINQVLKIQEKKDISNDDISPNTYTVKKGDNLYQIANKYNVSVDEIKKLNNLTTNNLSINQVLKIPGNNDTSPNTYTVKKGDTLYQIANKYNVSVEEIKKLNNLTTNNLSINQVLKIPGNNDISPNIYTIKKGDNLYQIANKYNVSVDEIKKLNNLTTNNLSINQVLKIPK
ncbi:MAG: LysM peptidoglycan-binding domain-containing protein, partial [Bacilli bacterium]|nr:LysM peptidoglycan-binding domain-containing protein [Bacilli bacterium]